MRRLLLASLAILLTLPATADIAPLRKPLRQPQFPSAKVRHGGRWYMATDGHAIFCYGPVMMVPTATGGIEKVATFCSDGRSIVPLHE